MTGAERRDAKRVGHRFDHEARGDKQWLDAGRLGVGADRMTGTAGGPLAWRRLVVVTQMMDRVQSRLDQEDQHQDGEADHRETTRGEAAR